MTAALADSVDLDRAAFDRTANAGAWTAVPLAERIDLEEVLQCPMST